MNQIKTDAKADEASILEALDARNGDYLVCRRHPKGPDNNHISYVTEEADALSAGLGEGAVASLISEAIANISRISVLALNVLALSALRAEKWENAEVLAGQVIARDHHDLMAQKILDAARAKNPSLETEVDGWLKTRQCGAPFQQFETRTNKTVHFCCSAWQPAPIGSFGDNASDDFWTSDTAKEIRRSVIEGDFSYCSRWHCPAIAARRLPKSVSYDTDSKGTPQRIILSHDRSCNISCPSCRKDLILLDHNRSNALNDLFEKELRSYVSDAGQVKVTGSGDPFGSRHFRHVLKSICADGPPRKRIQLHTNGLLANEKAWNDLNLWGNVTSIWVSVDAAKSDTYAILRRGGEFETLVKNLKFLGSLKEAGVIDSLRLDFVVQLQNFDEMGDFVDLAHRVRADRIYFLRLRNWGHFSADKFLELDVCDQGHPRHHELLTRLKDPRLAQSNVDLGSVMPLSKIAGESFYYS